MTKIKQIEIHALKAITSETIDLNGCSVLVTGKNRVGKTTLLRGMVDRIRGLRPNTILKFGEKEGKGVMELMNGEKFIWEFDEKGKDKLVYRTKDGYNSRVTGEIADKYFPKAFDIDTFMVSQPKAQLKMLADLVGLDFEKIDSEYTEAYNARTVANKSYLVEKVKFEEIVNLPKKVDNIDVSAMIKMQSEIKEKLNAKYLENKRVNDELRENWNKAKDTVNKEVQDFNSKQKEKDAAIKFIADYQIRLINLLHEVEGMNELVDFTMLSQHLDNLPKGEKLKDVMLIYPVEPEYIDEMPDRSELDAVDKKINDASLINIEAKKWSDFLETKKAFNLAEQAADIAEAKVLDIVERKKKMIQGARLPKGIEFGDDGVLVDGFPLDEQTISKSQKYCAAIRLGALQLGEVGALHFDASALDRANLMEIEEWASNYPEIEGGLQLLIERPDFDGGDIKYEIIQIS